MKRFFLPMIGMIALLVAVVILGNFVTKTVEHPEYDQGCSCMNGGIALWIDDQDTLLGIWGGGGGIGRSVASGESFTLLVRTEGLSDALPATIAWMPNMTDNAKFKFDPQNVNDNTSNDKNPAKGAITVQFTVTAPKEPGSYQTSLSIQGSILSVSVAVGSNLPASTSATTTKTISIPTDTSQLNEQEKYWLTYVYEEEKLARDVYSYLGDKWNFQIIKDMSNSEQKHMDTLKILLDNHGISDPIAGKGRGVFANSDLQNFYDKLIPQGSVSLVDSLKVGVLVEQKEIDDLKQGIANANHEDLKTVYGNLLNNSESIHLNAFEFELSKYSTTTSVSQTASQESGAMLTTESIIIMIVAVAAVALVGVFFLRRRRN